MITAEYLRANPQVVFVYGDNLVKRGKGGAAALRDEPNTYGFLTKKYPNRKPESYYTTEEYAPIFEEELRKFKLVVEANPDRVFLVAKLGGNLANLHGIYESIILPRRDDIIVNGRVHLLEW